MKVYDGSVLPRLRRRLPLALFLGVPSVLILPVLARGQMLGGADVASVFHYSRIAIADAFREGRLPVWDPHVMAGFPLLAAVQGAVFYPPTWLCLILPAGPFWTLTAGLHLVFAGVFAHRWMERGLGLNRWSATAGALVWMISGYISGHLAAGHVNYVWAYPWIPALLWRLERYLAAPTLRRGLLLALVLAMLFLAGVPQFVLFAALLVLARLGHFVGRSVDGRRDRAVQALRSAGWLTLGLAWSAPQLFPALELAGEMQRGGGGGLASVLDYSLKPADLGRLLIPPVRTSTPWWETCGYIGGAAFLLTLATVLGKHPQRYFWAAVAAVALILALGDTVPFYGGFVAVVPGAGWFRGPGRYLLLFTLAMAGLAGIGFEALWNRGSRGPRVLAGLLALAALGQLGHFAFLSIPGMTTSTMRMPIGVRDDLRSECGLEYRVANGWPDVAFIGKCQAEGIDQVCGYEPMMLRRYTELMNAARGAPHDTDFVIMASVDAHLAVRMLAVRAWLREPRAKGDLRIEPVRDPFPRSWVVNNAVVVEDRGKRLHTIGFGPWDPRKTVILESYPEEAPPTPTEAPAGKSKVLAKGPGWYEIEAENAADAYLVLSEAYYPGWTATVDGKKTDVLPANHLIQTIRLPAGKHVVHFRYRSRFLGLGFVVAALAALVPVGLLVRRHRRELALQRLPGAP